MSKGNIIALVFLMIALFAASVFYINYVNEPGILQGTYLSDDNSMLSMVFDNRDDNEFYFYHLVNTGKGMKQVVDKGSFKKIKPKVYSIKSGIFSDVEIEYHRKSFTILIDDKEYHFEQWSDTPGYIDLVDEAAIIDDKESKILDYQQQVDQYQSNLQEKNDELNDLKAYLNNQETFTRKVDLIVEGDHYINSYSTGKTVLEDGIIYVLEYYDPDKELIWMKTWNGIHVSELASWSDYTIYDNRMYLVVSRNLYIIDLKTGETLFTTPQVGSSDEGPTIHKSRVYILGQYTPFLTVLDLEGHVLWQVTDTKYSNPFEMKVQDDYVEIENDDGVFRFNLEGDLID